jgi:hypothetical protein
MKLRIVKIQPTITNGYGREHYIVEYRFMFCWWLCTSYLETTGCMRPNYSTSYETCQEWITSRAAARQHWVDVNNPKREIISYISKS